MSQVTTEDLRTLVTSALERTAFVIVDPREDGDTAGLAPATHHAKVHYTGPGSGTVYISASTGFLLELASSILGVEPGEVRLEVEGQDALRELANIIGGSAIVALGGESQPYSLGLPEIIKSFPSLKPQAACTFDSMGEPLRVSWCPDAARKAA